MEWLKTWIKKLVEFFVGKKEPVEDAIFIEPVFGPISSPIIQVAEPVVAEPVVAEPVVKIKKQKAKTATKTVKPKITKQKVVKDPKQKGIKAFQKKS